MAYTWPGIEAGDTEYPLIIDALGQEVETLDADKQEKADYTRVPYYAVDSSTTVNLITITVPNYPSYVDGSRFLVKVKNTNTSTTVTLKINSLAAKYVVIAKTASPYIGDLNADVTYEFVYNATIDKFRIQAGQFDAYKLGGQLPSYYATSESNNEKISISSIVNNDTTGGAAVPASAEIVKAHGAEIDALDSEKVDIASIVNDLTTGGADVPLSAEQGKVLKGLVDNHSASIDENSTSISELANSTVKFSAEQALTTAQRYQARKNIGAAAAVDIKDAYELQEAVRQGRASQILSVGDFFTVGRGGTDWLFQVAAFDYDVPVKAQYTHSMRMLMYPCFANVPFDAPEAIYYAAAELAAGTYWFINNRTNKYYSFTTTQAIPVGGQAVPVFGASPDYAITQIKTYASQTSTTALETVTATISDTAPTIGTQLTPVNDDNRARWGNNNWMQSAIRQWLNSAATTGWWTAKNIYDRPQSSPTDGFLNGIDADLLACIGKVRLRTGLNPVDNAGVFGSSDNEELIFLPSRTEMGLGNSGTNIYETPVAADGTAKTDTLPLFKSNADRIKYLAGVARGWWVRSPNPYAALAYNTYTVYTDGSLNGTSALNGYGAVPACVIY